MDRALGLEFHHFGLASRNAEDSVRFLRSLGYRCPEPVWDPLQQVNLQLCWHASMPKVEIIFAATGRRNPVDGLLSQYPKGAVYHLCFSTFSLDSSLASMRQAGLDLREIVKPTPAVLFGGRKVSFHVVSGLGLIEILEQVE